MIVRLRLSGLCRVLDGRVGMTFVVAHLTPSASVGQYVAHVRDYRYDSPHGVIWSLAPYEYDIITEPLVTDPADDGPEVDILRRPVQKLNTRAAITRIEEDE